MELSIPAFIIGLVLNTAWCMAMYIIQQREIRAGIIQKHGTKVPGTNQRFLHWQDFYCQRFGNTIGLTILSIGFCHLVFYGFITSNQWIILVTIIAIDAIEFTIMCLGSKHKPDSGYPKIGQVSWCGLTHSIYHGMNMAMAILCVWHLIAGNLLGPVMWLTLVGGIFYLLCNAADIKSGHFDQIKYNQ